MTEAKDFVVGWVKITTTMFDDEKIKFIDSLPDRDALLIIWVKLIAQAGKCNARGFIFLTENIPFSPETLATVFNRPPNTVRLALETFQKLGMIEWSDNHLALLNFEKHQNIDGLERINEQNRLRVARYRERQKQVIPELSNVTSSLPVTSCNSLESSISSSPSSSLSLRNNNVTILLAEKLRHLILQNNPKARTPTLLDKWDSVFDLMIRRDHRTEEEIEAIMDYSQSDNFWKTNILSPESLRKHFDRLTLQSQNRIGGVNETYRSGNGSSSNRFGNRLQEVSRHITTDEERRRALDD